MDDIRAMLKAGADKTSLNTAAVQNPDVVRAGAERFGSQCIVVAVDAKRSRQRKSGKCSPTAGGSGRPRCCGMGAVCRGAGAGEILLTSMDADGTKAGYDVALTRAISEAVHIR